MNIVYKWKITQIESYKKIDNFENVVFKIYYECLASYENYEIACNDNCQINFVNENFTSYENLKKDQVLEWVWNSINKQEIEEKLKNKIQQEVNNPVVVTQLPW
jgi:hypothetical protein